MIVASVEFGRLQGIQIMRYVAAVGVLLVHLQWKLKQYYDVTMVPAVSNTAIDLFFMISGFVVALALRDQRIGPWHFFGRRILRIYPPYFVLTALAWLAFLIRPDQVNSSGGTTNVLASFLVWPGPYKFLIENAWTLPHEFTFYALAAFAFFFRAGRQWVLLATIVAAWVAESLLGAPMGQQFVMIDFLSGIFVFQLTAWLAARGVRITQLRMLALPIALAVFVYASQLSGLTFNRFLGVNLIWGACLLLMSLMDVRAGRVWGALATMGDCSYAIYLSHPFTLKLIFMLLPSDYQSPTFLVAVVALSLVASTVVGAAFFRFIEEPMRSALPRLKSN